MIPLIIGALLQQGLPLIANAVLGKGKEWVEEKTGVKLPSMEATTLTPEQIATLKNAELVNKQVLMSAIKEIELAEIADVASARELQKAALASSSELGKAFIYWLTAFWSITASLYVGCVTFIKMPVGNERYADTILGFLLGTALGGIFNYFYGSSRSSNNSNSTISKLLDKLSDKD